ncbi:transposase, partial [Streptococcus pneumoniae]|uniref:transposase n=6 Tax=Streptococcus pneumoniae TaxID=1313 RepID=UPI000A8BFC02
ETGFDTYFYREYGRSLKGQLRRGKVSGRRYQRISLVAGLTNGELIAPMTYEETMTSDFFEAWFRKFLLLILNTPSIIIMDNARFHRMGKLELLCEEFGHKLLPLLVSIDYNNLIKIIKRNANFEKFKTRILIALNIKKERTKGVAFDEFNEIISRF